MQGRLPFRTFETWYEIVGEEELEGRLPLLVLHGGPGGAHDALGGLGALTEQGRRIVFYDQLGSGESSRPDDPSLWTVETFVEQLGSVREGLGLERIHLFGSSWGGMLAMEYALRRKPGLASLIVASSPASMRQWVTDTARLRSELPQEVQETLSRHEEAGTTDSEEYE
jgi:proline-specific peptidase